MVNLSKRRRRYDKTKAKLEREVRTFFEANPHPTKGKLTLREVRYNDEDTIRPRDVFFAIPKGVHRGELGRDDKWVHGLVLVGDKYRVYLTLPEELYMK